jgi:S-sulfosulfanyl-L-cysteine sulfohydrolase
VLAAKPGAGERLYDVPKFGNVSFLHFTDCHAQLTPIYFREPNVNLGVAEAVGKPPHIVGERCSSISASSPARPRRTRSPT